MAKVKVECGRCDGTGKMDCPVEYDDHCPEDCPSCGGAQKVRCCDCNGTGEQEEEE